MIPSTVTLVAVGPRDGLQNEAQTVSTAHKVDCVHRLQEAGLREIEVTGFVSPKWVPQMANNAAVMAALPRRSGLGIESGIDLDAWVDAGAFISGVLGRSPVSRVGRAVLSRRGATA